MNLFQETGLFARWYGAVFSTFVRAKPLTTVSLVLCSALAKLTHILARVLPIKVLLLAAGHGVPSYFQPFLSPDQRTFGLVILIAATLLCYVADSVLETVARRLAESGSQKVVENANDIVLTSHRRKAQGTYVSVAEMTSNFLFAGGFFGVICFIDPPLFGLLAGCFTAAFLATAWFLRGDIYEHHRSIAIFVRDELDAYLDILSILIFVSAFLFIVYPFLAGGDANVLLAILAIAFLRRTLRAVTSAISSAASLFKRNVEVNALIFREHQVRRRERPESRSLREMFGLRRRQKLVERELSKLNGGTTAFSTRWLNPTGGAQRFSIAATFNSGRHTTYLMRIFAPSRIASLDSEEILFRHVPRQALLAPPVAARFTAATFECQLNDLGAGAEPANARSWRQTYAHIIETLWSVAPPESLVTAHRSLHAAIDERLTPELINRAAVAISNDEDAKVLSRLLQQLPRIQSELRGLPLYISNPNLELNTVWQRENGEFFLSDWGHWSLRTFGAGHVPLRGDPNAINALLNRVRARRPDVPDHLDATHVLLAASCADLEKAIERGSYRTALRTAEALVSGQPAALVPLNDADSEEVSQQEVA